MSSRQTSGRRGGRAPGAEGYDEEDVFALLGCINRVLPIGGNDWERVLHQYRDSYAIPNGRALRESMSIKAKF